MMALIDSVRAICRRLVPHGWGELLAKHGLNITADDLERELRKELPVIDRQIPGFEDFASEGRRGIEPGQPARSLLYHALASPNVVAGARGEILGAFPTLAEIRVVENFVFGVEPPSLAELITRFPGAMAVAVFASEYRPGAETVHRRHADLCFSRTGVARVGTVEPFYDARARGFLPLVEGDDRAFRVLPAQYAPYIAVQLSGQEELFGPMDFDLRQQLGLPDPLPDSGDETLNFWVPLHKLFSGPECVRGLDLSVTLEAHHVNEKIRRIHKELRRLGHDTGRQESDLDWPPFIFTEDIAEFLQDPDSGEGVLTPVVHEKLVKPAVYRGKPLTYKVPPIPDNDWAPSLEISAEGLFRHAPEYVHARHEIRPDETVRDLNGEENVAELVREGGYQARHYVDFTGDGWVEATCPELAVVLPRSVPAYSTVTSPDFYPMVEQRELIEWWTQRVPRALRDRIWPRTTRIRRPAPYALSDVRFAPNLELRGDRLPPNLQLRGADFRSEDRTVTAIVSLPTEDRAQRPLNPSSRPDRHVHLPDAAASVFAPGWDTSLDRAEDETWHLASYGLGSPFPEDSKLCAALSSFWPAVSPDSGRSFSRPFFTVTPMTDEEIGSVGDLPWDGVAGPRPVSGGNGTIVEYARFDYVDYVQSALDESFSLALTSKVTFIEYIARILAMARAYEALDIDPGEPNALSWRVLSFRGIVSEDEELRDAEAETGVKLQGTIYRITFGRSTEVHPSPDDHRKARVNIAEIAVLFAGVLPQILLKRADISWRAIPTH